MLLRIYAYGLLRNRIPKEQTVPFLFLFVFHRLGIVCPELIRVCVSLMRLQLG